MNQAFLMSIVVTAGCVGEPAPEPAGVDPRPILAPGVPGPGDPLDEDPEQGRHLLGEFADRQLAGSTRHYRVRATATNGFDVSVLPAGPGGVNGSNLTATDGTVTFSHADPRFEQMTFLDFSGGELRITGVSGAPADSVVPSTRYTLEYNPGNGIWVPYCKDGGGAIALQGEYDLQRTHILKSSTLTFSCEDGGATKCDKWGYVAGTAGPTSSDWKHNQACLGMTSALYCGDGQSFTREKTPIRIRDFRPGYGNPPPADLPHPDPMPGDPDTFYVEAGWDERGRPVCLSKLRWRGLPPDPCPGVLPDPRMPHTPEAFFCDDLPATDLWKEGAVLVNGSPMMDAPLQHWRNLSTGDDVMTIRGFYLDRDGTPGPDSDTTYPFDGYTEYIGTDGMVLRNLPGTLDETMMLPLYMQTSGDDRFLSATKPPAAEAAASFEGYAFLGSTSTVVKGLTALKLCTPPNGDLVTTIGPTAACTSVTSLEYALRAPY
jgi:hypothetical protein